MCVDEKVRKMLILLFSISFSVESCIVSSATSFNLFSCCALYFHSLKLTKHTLIAGGTPLSGRSL